MANLLPDHAQREALLQTHLNQPQGSALAPGKPKSYYAGSDAATPPPLPGVLVQRERAQRGSRGMRAGAGPEVLVLQEGLVWIKRWMSRETQQWLVDETCDPRPKSTHPHKFSEAFRDGEELLSPSNTWPHWDSNTGADETAF